MDGRHVLILLVAVIVVGCRSVAVRYGTSSLDPHPVDSDNDMLTDFEENVFTETNPYKADTDGDGLPDGWKWLSGLDPLSPEGNDGPDGGPYLEGVTNIEKYQRAPDQYKNRSLFYEIPE